MNNQEITQIVRAAQSGNSEAFEELVRLYFGLVHAIAWGTLRNAEDAQEIAQEAFLRVYLRLADLRDPEMFVPWLRRVTQSLATNHLQRDQRRKLIAPTIAIDEKALQMADESLRDNLERRDHERRLTEAIARLPEGQREILLLYYAEGWTMQAISERLAVDPTTVGRRIDRAVKLLREKVGPAAVEEARRLGSSRRAQARTLATIAVVAALPAVSRAALVAAAEIPAPAAIAAKVSPLASLISSLLSVAPKAAVTGAAVMSKGKLIVVAAAIVVATAGGGTAYYYSRSSNDSSPKSSASTQVLATGATVPSPAPSQHGHWLVGGWYGNVARKSWEGSLVLRVEESPTGEMTAITYLPGRATGVRRSSNVIEAKDGTFRITFPGIAGGITGSRNGNTLNATLHEDTSNTALSLQRADTLPPVPVPSPRNEIALDEATLSKYAGTYARTSIERLVAARNNNALLVSTRGYDPLLMYPDTPTSFFSKEADVQLQFELDAAGNVLRVAFVEGHTVPPNTQYYRPVQ